MPPILHSFESALLPYAGPLLAAAVALLGAWLCRAKAGRPMLPAVASAAVLVGWAADVPRIALLQSASAPHTGPALLLLPAAAALGLFLLALWWLKERTAAAATALVTAWWVAASPAGRPEFWRVWVAGSVLAWLLSKVSAGQPGRNLATGIALFGGLAFGGAGLGWTEAALVAAAAGAGLVAAGPGAAVPAGLMSGLVLGADLATGRLVRGGLNANDIACAVACLVPLLAGRLEPRTKRLGAIGPAVAGIVAGLLGAGATWVARRAMRS